MTVPTLIRCSLCTAITIFICLGCTPALAQESPDARGINLRTHIGFSGYWGDVQDPTGETGALSGPTLAWEFGFPVQNSYRIAGTFKAGNYPRLDPSGTWHTWRFTGQVLVRYLTNPSEPISPFFHVGGHVTTGRYQSGPDTESSTRAYGPSVGGGWRYTVSRNVAIFAETTFHAAIPDDAVDGLSTSFPVDLLNSTSAGVRFRLNPSSRSLKLTNIQAADSLRIGEEGIFATSADHGETEAVTYTWRFGDGSTAEGTTVRHSYQKPGRYTVTVNASTPEQNSSTSTEIVVAQTGGAENSEMVEACSQALETAETRYRSQQYPAAVDTLQTCLGSEAITADQKVEAYRLRTLIQLKRGDVEAAKNTLLQILATKPGYEADPVHDPPGYVSLVSLVKQQVGQTVDGLPD